MGSPGTCVSGKGHIRGSYRARTSSRGVVAPLPRKSTCPNIELRIALFFIIPKEVATMSLTALFLCFHRAGARPRSRRMSRSPCNRPLRAQMIPQ